MPDRLVDINLLPRYERRREGSSVLFFLFLILTIAAFIAIGVFYYMYKGNLSSLEAEYQTLQTQEETLQAELASLDIAEAETLRHSVQFAEGQVLETSKLITTIDELLPRNGYLNSYSFRSREASITTHIGSLEAIASYTTELTNSNYFYDAKLLNVRTIIEETEEESERKYYEANFSLDVERQMLKKGDED